MTSQTEEQTTIIHLLPDISWSKGNQTMKFLQLIKYDMKYLFVAKSYTKWGGENSLRPFFKNIKIEYTSFFV